MHTRMYEFLENSKILYDLQFGFRKKHSTDHALLDIIESIKEKLDEKIFSCGVFIDLEKAFDTVNHDILLKNYISMELEEFLTNGLNVICQTENNGSN